MGIEKLTCCQIKCTPLETISSYLSVLLFFRGSFHTAKRSIWAGNPSLFDSRAHLGSSVSKKRWHQTVPRLLFFLSICLWFCKRGTCGLQGHFMYLGSKYFCLFVCWLLFGIAAVAIIDINLYWTSNKLALTISHLDMQHVIKCFFILPIATAFGVPKSICMCVCAVCVNPLSGSNKNTSALQLME